jgi:hypothetical protein
MTWRDLHDQLVKQLDALNPQIEAERPKTPLERIEEVADLLESEKMYWPEIDNAIRDYIASGTWPALEHKKTILIYARLAHAVQFCQFLLGSPHILTLNPIEDSHKASVLHFLFVEYWHFAGKARWRSS